MSAAAPGLRVDNVSVHFAGLTALDDVPLSASPGQLLGVIGPTRQNYARVIPTVDYAARIVSRMLGG